MIKNLITTIVPNPKSVESHATSGQATTEPEPKGFDALLQALSQVAQIEAEPKAAIENGITQPLGEEQDGAVTDESPKEEAPDTNEEQALLSDLAPVNREMPVYPRVDNSGGTQVEGETAELAATDIATNKSAKEALSQQQVAAPLSQTAIQEQERAQEVELPSPSVKAENLPANNNQPDDLAIVDPKEGNDELLELAQHQEQANIGGKEYKENNSIKAVSSQTAGSTPFVYNELENRPLSTLSRNGIAEAGTTFQASSKDKDISSNGIKPTEVSDQMEKLSQEASSIQKFDTTALAGKDAEKKPELLQTIQNAKEVSEKSEPTKEFKTVLSTRERAEARSQLLSDQERIEVPTRQVKSEFSSHTSANQEKVHSYVSPGLSDEQEKILQEYLKSTTGGKEKAPTSEANVGYMRLTEMPVVNGSLRKSLVSNLTHTLQKEFNFDKEATSSTWQKHTFELEDGNSLNLTTRNVDGVLHIKLAASNHELVKMLQQAGEELQEHLEKELQMELDLQFEGNQQEEMPHFAKESSNFGTGSRRIGTPLAGEEENPTINKSITQAVRRFGYNQMEWTA